MLKAKSGYRGDAGVKTVIVGDGDRLPGRRGSRDVDMYRRAKRRHPRTRVKASQGKAKAQIRDWKKAQQSASEEGGDGRCDTQMSGLALLLIASIGI